MNWAGFDKEQTAHKLWKCKEGAPIADLNRRIAFVKVSCRCPVADDFERWTFCFFLATFLSALPPGPLCHQAMLNRLPYVRIPFPHTRGFGSSDIPSAHILGGLLIEMLDL